MRHVEVRVDRTEYIEYDKWYEIQYDSLLADGHAVEPDQVALLADGKHTVPSIHTHIQVHSEDTGIQHSHSNIHKIQDA